MCLGDVGCVCVQGGDAVCLEADSSVERLCDTVYVCALMDRELTRQGLLFHWIQRSAL